MNTLPLGNPMYLQSWLDGPPAHICQGCGDEFQPEDDLEYDHREGFMPTWADEDDQTAPVLSAGNSRNK